MTSAVQKGYYHLIEDINRVDADYEVLMQKYPWTRNVTMETMYLDTGHRKQDLIVRYRQF